uniref:Uncharacterized protein n=1 Tax=Anguilla anguilla TaxID=7936 RepID=A0A0E9Q8A2_ANGAN
MWPSRVHMYDLNRKYNKTVGPADSSVKGCFCTAELLSAFADCFS